MPNAVVIADRIDKPTLGAVSPRRHRHADEG
jgi:hypothetical protein